MIVFKPDIKRKSYVVFGVACALVVGIYCWSAQPGFHEVINAQAKDSYYNLLVQGFQAGQLNVNREAPPELAGLANPYDPAAYTPYVWEASHISYELCYYKGKLYLYQGITPALVWFLPFTALTGEYCSHQTAVVIFLVFGFLVAALLMFSVWQRYFSDVSVWLVATTVLALGLATGFLGNLSSADEHQVPHLCGFAFTMLALAAIWNSLHRPRWQIYWLASASLAYGLAVGARPSLLFGIIILLIPVVQGWRTDTGIFSFKRASCLLLAAVVPAALVGMGLAAYNYLRFDSPSEFGWRYLLTDIQNVSAQPFSLRYFWFNWKLYFLEPVHWNGQFPFLRADVPAGAPANYYGVGEAYCGILLHYPVVWLALAAPLAWRDRSAKDIPALRAFLWVVLLLFLTNTLILCCFFSGSSGYLSDFLPALMMLAIIGVWGLDRTLQNWPRCQRLMRLGWGLLLGYSIVFGYLASIKACAYAQHTMGNSLFHANRNDEAMEYFRKSVALDSGNSVYRIGLGNACIKRGDFNEAISQYQKVVEMDPENIEALYDLSLSLIQVGQLGQASVHFHKLIRLQPDYAATQNPSINNNIAWSLATNPEPSQRNGDMAVVLAEAACRKTNYRTTVMVGTLAAAYAEAGSFDEAISTAQKACALAAAAGDQLLYKKNQEFLGWYRQHKAYHQTPADVPHEVD